MKRIRSSRSSPEGIPRPDNQGNSKQCTRFALSKALINGFMNKKFFPNKELDFVQEEVKSALMNEHKDNAGKYPSEFHGRSYQFQENETKDVFNVNVKVIEIPKPKHHEELREKKENFEYVLVYSLQSSIPCMLISMTQRTKKLLASTVFLMTQLQPLV